MAPVLHYCDLSPISRGVLLTVKALDIEVEYKYVDMLNSEHLSEDYLKMNPQHTVPVLEDDGLIICDSHAINNYLVEKYSEDKSLYPNDLEKRATINQRQHFNCGVLFPKLVDLLKPLATSVDKAIPKDKANAIALVYGFVDTFIGDNSYLAGNFLSVADFSVVATVTTLNLLVPIESSRFPKLTEWLSRMARLSYYAEANQVGLDKFAEMCSKTVLNK